MKYPQGLPSLLPPSGKSDSRCIWQNARSRAVHVVVPLLQIRTSGLRPQSVCLKWEVLDYLKTRGKVGKFLVLAHAVEDLRGKPQKNGRGQGIMSHIRSCLCRREPDCGKLHRFIGNKPSQNKRILSDTLVTSVKCV